MKITFIIMLFSLMQVSAASFGQNVTLKKEKISLENAFREIRKQTGYDVLLSAEVDRSLVVRVDFDNVELAKVLYRLLAGLPLEYSVDQKTIVVKEKRKSFLDRVVDKWNSVDVRGKVVDEEGNALAGANIIVKSTKINVVSGGDGVFLLKGIDENAVLVISYQGYVAQELNAKDFVNGGTVRMIVHNLSLNEVVVNKGYYKTRKELETGNVSVVTSKDIERQVITNPLSALQGRVPGLFVNFPSGAAGATPTIQLRGKGSLLQGSSPLFIIDGVPFAPSVNKVNQLGGTSTDVSGQGGISLFGSLNPADIESVEVLKDADATAIYGSRGANGVILITTKKGSAGNLKFDANLRYGVSRPTKIPKLLNTDQYLQMRREAFKNDGVTPTVTNAPDLMIWDNTSFTDWIDLLAGNIASNSDANISISGGDDKTQFLFGGGYHDENSVYSAKYGDRRGSMNLSIAHTTSDKKFEAALTANYSVDDNQMINIGASNFFLPPNTPGPYNADGSINWGLPGASFNNPLAFLLSEQNIETNNLLGNLSLGYHPIKDLTLRSNFGYNNTIVVEGYLRPIAYTNPNSVSNPTGSSGSANNKFNTWIIEPQIDYSRKIGKFKLGLLLGASLQNTVNTSDFINLSGYSSDALLYSQTPGAAPNVDNRGNDYSKYRYSALYGRLNFNWNDKYLINVTARRDGSSRFGPGRKFGSFGAIGLAWVFSNENFIKDLVPFVSTGKLRGSYGITGNDQIGNYQYLDTWTTTLYSYVGGSSIQPSKLFNADYSWERNRKLEGGIELGLFNDRIYVEGAYYRNRSDNQLLNYQLPIITGFNSVLKNFPALIENRGWEFSSTFSLIKSRQLNWNSSFNITIPKNTLLDFPGLSNTSYANTYIIGQSINLLKKFHSLGVDPTTGVYVLQDINGDNTLNASDFVPIGNTDPKFYGGWQNTLTWRGLEFSFFLEFKKRMGANYLNSIYNSNTQSPGLIYNQPIEVLERWQNPGDQTVIQRYTATTSTNAYRMLTNLRNADLGYSDAAYLRLRSASLSYELPNKWTSKIGVKHVKVYLMGQNLLTITGYKVGDPETLSYTGVQMLKSVVFGTHINL